ncbi:MAG: ABC transporter ATP-binding protein [Planctomycetaceae bacterium]
MNLISRLGNYLWPYRRRLGLSVFCAVMISLLWSLNLSITFPIVKVLFENDSLHTFVDQEIERIDEEIAEYSHTLGLVNEDQISEQARIQRKLRDASQALVYRQWLKNSVLPWIPSDKFHTILAILAFVLVATIVKGCMMYAQELLVGGVVHASCNDIRKDTFENVVNLDYQTVQEIGSPQLTSRLTNDVSELGVGLNMFASQLVREPLKAFCCIAAAFFFNWRLTCLSILVLPAIGFLFYRSGRVMRSAARNTLETMSNIYRSVSESLDATRVVIAFSGEAHHLKQLESANTCYYDTSMKLIRISALIRPVTELLGMIAFTLVLIPGAYLVLNSTDQIFGVKMASGPLTMSELTTLYVLMAGALDPIRKLSGVFPMLKRSLAAADRIFAITDTVTAVPETASPVAVQPHHRNISFEDISFRYSGEAAKDLIDSAPALRAVDLTVNFGEVVAVVGGNGSGKSTLISLLPRLMDPARGTIRIDGVNTRDMSLKDLRQQIGLVTQDTMLFDDTIFNNVLYGNPSATLTEVEDAIKQAHASDFVSLLPQGLSTRVGAKGQKLSGGQKQRISLARAIVRNPAILILDEATSAVDAESEALIYDVLRDFSKGRTVFIISHVISRHFVDLIDRVVVLDGGQIIADGSHQHLLSNCPQYSRLVQPEVTRRAA